MAHWLWTHQRPPLAAPCSWTTLPRAKAAPYIRSAMLQLKPELYRSSQEVTMLMNWSSKAFFCLHSQVNRAIHSRLFKGTMVTAA